ncbi:ArsR/SmtB family transcription factor [Nocardioides sp. B-3]|uniref:ArsR/SmtB family transcription factor n=1 Tax=Nocardioides sp. B-3 TaxID=2895565 RepID=UPI002152637B|nr:helix-turn-helix domain-containing protein [Nocardioides sp. B-3]UUZ58478.1 helix-turn-helix domain-containing protein [Nocardioides sp. B-3]
MDEGLSALRSVAHPVRLRILSMLTAQPMSAAEVARELDLTHANASYHLRVLHDAGELVVESEEKIRGGTAKRYRYLVGGDPERPAGPSTNEDHLARQLATNAEVVRRLAQRAKGPGSSSDIETWVTPEAWQQAMEAISEAMILLHEQARPPRSEGTIHVSASTQAFRMDDHA